MKCVATQPIMKRKNIIGSICNLLNFSDFNSFFTFCCCYKSYFCTHCTLIVLTVFTPKLSIFDDKRFTFLRFTAPTNIYFISDRPRNEYIFCILSTNRHIQCTEYSNTIIFMVMLIKLISGNCLILDW